MWPSEAINPDPAHLTHGQQEGEGEQAKPTSTARGKAEKRRGDAAEKWWGGEGGGTQEKQQQRRFNAWVRKA